MYAKSIVVLVAVALVAACGSSDSSSGSTSTSTGAIRSADEACEAAKSRTRACKPDAGDDDVGDRECRGVRCAWSTFKDASMISDRMAKRDCKDNIDDALDVSIQARIDEPGVRDFVSTCQAKAAKSPADGGCNDPNKRSFIGHCDYFAAMTDSARVSFRACLSKSNCDEFEACYQAIFAGCGNWG